ncbi:MAG: trigger factor [Nitrospira sp.]|nr:trigger factor [Candidatus Manganitrophaceae bacterium]HIL35156.1 trigger factor [Candidatus Manganitrophaceae bacterium]
MKVEVEEITSVKKILKIEIPQEVVASEFAQAYSKLKKTVKIPGFRPGKVPLALVEKKFGAAVEEDVLRKLVPDYYQKAIKELDISPVEFPSFDKIEAKKNAPLHFTATVEVRPVVHLSDYKGLILPRKKINVADEDVMKTLERIQEEQGHQEACSDGHAIVSDDYVTIDFAGSVDGKLMARGSAQGYTLRVGSNTFLPEFEDALLSKKRGKSFEAAVPFPENYQEKEIAGKTVSFKIEVKEIKKKVLPKIDDDLAKDVGLSSLDTLKEKVHQTLMDQKTSQQKHDQNSILIKKLVELHPIDVPPSMVDREIHNSLANLQKAGPQKVDVSMFHKEYEPIARERIQGQFILSAIAEKENISVTDQEVDDEIKSIATASRISPEKAREMISHQDGSLEGLKSRIRQDKALKQVYSLAQFKDEGEKS